MNPQAFLHRFGLAGFVKAYDSDSFDFPLGAADVEIDLDDDFAHLWISRNVTEWEQGAPKGHYRLLRSTVGFMDICCHCGGQAGIHLYNRTNWRYLRRMRDTVGYWLSLPHNLGYNRGETLMLHQYLANNPARRSQTSDTEQPRLGNILEDLFDLPNVITSARLQQHMAQDGFALRTPDDWMCDGCIQAFMQQRLWIWWYRQKLLGRVLNETVREDCWYGYECRTQTHKPEHAARLNHLCVNTYPEHQAAKMAARAAQHSATGETSN
ncbi:hypothetical protein AURDEDRAFT_150800 [Auricularia subglabra TFB-10046 SS5]|nr:hypothetical protein AURDEDRAFT_150800 [Auricularia subglabra TFB-10046 SS5]